MEGPCEDKKSLFQNQERKQVPVMDHREGRVHSEVVKQNLSGSNSWASVGVTKCASNLARLVVD
jgi:hypothetical protein